MVREQLLDGVPVSAFMNKHKIRVTHYDQWQQQLPNEDAAIFERKVNGHSMRRQETSKEEKVD